MLDLEPIQNRLRAALERDRINPTMDIAIDDLREDAARLIEEVKYLRAALQRIADYNQEDYCGHSEPSFAVCDIIKAIAQTSL